MGSNDGQKENPVGNVIPGVGGGNPRPFKAGQATGKPLFAWTKVA
jgi:hypothetical protein